MPHWSLWFKEYPVNHSLRIILIETILSKFNHRQSNSLVAVANICGNLLIKSYFAQTSVPPARTDGPSNRKAYASCLFIFKCLLSVTKASADCWKTTPSRTFCATKATILCKNKIEINCFEIYSQNILFCVCSGAEKDSLA